MSRIVTGVNDIFALRPDLKEYWDYDKNVLDPNKTGARSNRNAWWVCKKCGNSFEQVIDTRYKSNGVCSVCSNKKVVSGINDIVTTHPHLLLEWNYERNAEMGIYPTELTYGSNKQIWWLCENGHEYQQTPNAKTFLNRGCPKCSNGKSTSYPEQYIYLYFKKLFDKVENRYKYGDTNFEIDIYIPELRLGIEYDGIRYHTKKVAHREERKNKDLNDLGIRLLRIKEEYNKNQGYENIFFKNDVFYYKPHSYIKTNCTYLTNIWWDKKMVVGMSNL